MVRVMLSTTKNHGATRHPHSPPLRTSSLSILLLCGYSDRSAIPPDEVGKVGIGALGEAVAPVLRILVHDEQGRRRRRLLGLAVGNDESETIASFGIERSDSATTSELRATGAFCSIRPVRSVYAVSSGEFLELSVVVD